MNLKIGTNTTLVLLAIFSLVLSGAIAALLPFRQHTPRVLSETDTISVTATVLACELEIFAVPEKRVTPGINEQNTNNAEFYGIALGDFKGEANLTADNLGVASINICDEGIVILPNESVDLFLTGQSHLTKRFPIIGAFNTVLTFVDTFAIGGVLLAGDTHPLGNSDKLQRDNFINELDLSTQVIMLTDYSGTTEASNPGSRNVNDLNQDSVVNELDLSNTIINFKVGGDCSPNQISNGVESCL